MAEEPEFLTSADEKNVRQRQRYRAFRKQRSLCWLCSRKMTHNAGMSAATWDHVVPRAAGGNNKLENRKLAHRACNLIRGTWSPDRGRRLIQELNDFGGKPIYVYSPRELAKLVRRFFKAHPNHPRAPKKRNPMEPVCPTEPVNLSTT